MCSENQSSINAKVSHNVSTSFIFMSVGNKEIAMAYGHAVCCYYSVPIFSASKW